MLKPALIAGFLIPPCALLHPAIQKVKRNGYYVVRILSFPADNSLFAYQLSKRGNSLRVKAEAVRWGKRGVSINTISPGIIITPLAHDELSGPRREAYQ